jgi:uncharacterized protein with GYD domain
MPTFVGMLSWTDQGARTVKDTPKRIQAARERAPRSSGLISSTYFLPRANSTFW